MPSKPLSYTQTVNSNVTSTTVINNNNNNSNNVMSSPISSSSSTTSQPPSATVQFTFRGNNGGANNNLNSNAFYDGENGPGGNFGFIGSTNNNNNNSNNNNNIVGVHDFANNGAPIVIDQLEWKDTYRHIFSNLPLVFFHILSLLITFFLVFIAIADRRAMQKTWYLLLEGIMVLFFTFDVSSRYILARSSVFGSYFSNKANLVEAIICGVCLIMFLFLLAGRTGGRNSAEYLERQLPHAQEDLKREEAEHELVVVVRFAFQLFRGVLYLRNVARARRDNAEDSSGVGGGNNRGFSMHHNNNSHHHHHQQQQQQQYFQRSHNNSQV